MRLIVPALPIHVQKQLLLLHFLHMIEIELKYVVDNLGKLQKRLIAMGAMMSKDRRFELSVMYDNAAGLMQETDGRIRVRQSGNQIEFCYKKPLTREGIKQEIEHEVTVSALEPLIDILTAMDYHSTTSYERYRTELRYRDVKVTLDEYPFAHYIEFEGQERDITQLAIELGFSQEKNLTASCDTLFTEWRKDRGLPPTSHMRFDTYDK